VDEVALKALAMKRARQTILIADNNKLNMRKFAPVCPLAAVDLFVTNRESTSLFGKHGIRFRRVEYC
jgi:DeoR/GlpR family transcriptional regulator of sugar metabolism